ncbi:MAG: hypothetical protein MR964_08395 [Campylobacter sp.]|uniref:hypothetical protein n=1 Tax=Campylobacter sp. TaxID=205 RepID=UPI002AA816BB|nr:hypothetical protein [Campylobacter sp.]MCI7024219.1 hypothetical protein [Campylobacter sp.]
MALKRSVAITATGSKRIKAAPAALSQLNLKPRNYRIPRQILEFPSKKYPLTPKKPILEFLSKFPSFYKTLNTLLL